MTKNQYTAPEANLNNEQGGEDLPTGIFSAKGRLRRSSYFFQTIILMLIAMAALAVSGIITAIIGSFGIVLIAAVYIAILYSSYCLIIKRLHDLGKSGWMCLIGMIPLVGFVFAIWVLFFKGDESSNFYGDPNPKNKTHLIVGLIGYVAMPVLFGILAAVAIPQYQSYVERTQSGAANIEEIQRQMEAGEYK